MIADVPWGLLLEARVSCRKLVRETYGTLQSQLLAFDSTFRIDICELLANINTCCLVTAAASSGSMLTAGASQIIGAMTWASVGRRAAAAIEADARCTGVDELEDIDRNFHLCLLVPTRRIYLKKKKQTKKQRDKKRETLTL